jgi:hypothetical protein
MSVVSPSYIHIYIDIEDDAKKNSKKCIEFSAHKSVKSKGL